MFIFLNSPSIFTWSTLSSWMSFFSHSFQCYPRYFACLLFYINFNINLYSSIKKACWYFYRVCIKSINWFKEHWHLYNVDSSHPRREDIFPFVQVSIFAFLECFKFFTSRLYPFLKFIPKYLIIFIAVRMEFSLTLWTVTGCCLYIYTERGHFVGGEA